MNDFVHVVTAVDYGETCDGKARILGAYRDREAAKAMVRSDIENFIDMQTSDDGSCQFIADFDGMSVSNKDGDAGCEWNIESVEVS